MSDRPMDEQELAERFRAWLHAEATVGETSPGPLRDRVDAIPAVTPDRRWAWLRLQSLAPVAAIAATVLIAVALTVVGLGPIQPFLATAPDETGTAEELDAAVTSAIEALAESPGVEGVQVAYIGEHLSSAVWFNSRPNGDVVVVQRVDVDVTHSGWWLNPTEGPPATGRNIVTTIRVLAGDAFYEAVMTNGVPADGWSVTDREAAPRGPLAFGLVLLAGEDSMFGLPSDGDVTHEESADGGSVWTLVWTLTAPYREGSAVQTWQILPDGKLGAWWWELSGVSLPMEVDTNPTTSGRIDFTPLASPKSINAPDAEGEPNLAEFDLPDDFPLGSD